MRFPLPLDRPVPGPLRSLGIQVLCSTFARAFYVQAPDVVRLPAPQALRAFREFSAACIEEALADPVYATARRVTLEAVAYELGSEVREALRPDDAELPQLVHLLYSAIDIDVDMGPEGAFVFKRCSFACRYTPQVCGFMSAFDSGFVGGLCGGGALQFQARITEGAPCCRACLVGRESGVL